MKNELTNRQIVRRLNAASDVYTYRVHQRRDDEQLQRRRKGTGGAWAFICYPSEVYESIDGTLCACGQGVE